MNGRANKVLRRLALVEKLNREMQRLQKRWSVLLRRKSRLQK